MPSRARIALTSALREEYAALFRSCTIVPQSTRAVERGVERLLAHQQRYERVAQPLGVPWQFVAVVHALESAQDFRSHLHNGDPLSARTRRVPAGRPLGEPPFEWEVSAIDALRLRNLHRVRDWSLPSLLYRLEAYNGFGYRLHHPEVLSPYLWSGSNHYVRGKYVRDGVWDANAVSTQTGGAVLLRRLAELGYHAAPGTPGSPEVVPFHPKRPRDRTTRAHALALQHWLNTHAGVFLREDGWPGTLTSSAYRQVTGNYLPGDPRGA